LGCAGDRVERGGCRMGDGMRGEISREKMHYTSGDWVNRPEINLSGWPINRKGQRVGRLNAGATNMARKFLARYDQEQQAKKEVK